MRGRIGIPLPPLSIHCHLQHPYLSQAPVAAEPLGCPLSHAHESCPALHQAWCLIPIPTPHLLRAQQPQGKLCAQRASRGESSSWGLCHSSAAEGQDGLWACRVSCLIRANRPGKMFRRSSGAFLLQSNHCTLGITDVSLLKLSQKSSSDNLATSLGLIIVIKGTPWPVVVCCSTYPLFIVSDRQNPDHSFPLYSSILDRCRLLSCASPAAAVSSLQCMGIC